MAWFRRRKQGHTDFRYYADTVEGSSQIVDRKDNGQVYIVSRVKSLAVALDYLRRTEVRDEGVYHIVETPGRSVGRDMVMIFDEADGSVIEIPDRTPLPDVTPSTTHCSRCGYPVLPAGGTAADRAVTTRSVVEFAQPADVVIARGWGYRCTSCDSLACAACYAATGENSAVTADGTRWHACWVCAGAVTAFVDLATGR